MNPFDLSPAVRLGTLGARERQIAEIVYRLGEAGVSEVLAEIPDPPTYSAVRAMLNVLVRKGFLDYRREKVKYLYYPVVARDDAGRSAIRQLLKNFFAGKPTDAVAALLDVAAKDMDDADFRDLKDLIEKARKGGR